MLVISRHFLDCYVLDLKLLNTIAKGVANFMTKEKKIILLVYILPLVYGLIYIAIFGTNLMVGDDWIFLNSWFNYKETGDLWSTLWEPLFGHIEVLPKIIQYATLPFCHWNVKVVMFEMQIFVFGAYVVLLKQARYRSLINDNLSSAQNIKRFAFCAIGLAFVCFSAIHWETYTWAVNIGIVMCFMFTVLCFYLLHRYFDTTEYKYLVGAVISLLAAVLCHGTGFAICAVIVGMFFVELIMACYYKNKIDYAAYIIIVIAILCSAYIYKDALGAGAVLSENIFYYLKYYLIISGDMFAPGYGFMEPYMYFYAGVLGLVENALSLVIFIRLIKHNQVKKYRFELYLMAFSVCFRMMVLLQRSGLGYESALYSHYAISSVLNIASLILIFVGEGFELSKKNYNSLIINGKMGIIYKCLVALFIAYSLACLVVSYSSMRTRRNKVDILLNYESETYEEIRVLGLWGDDEEMARSEIKRAQENEINVFYGAAK